jgi:hypothetical protein
MTIHMQVEQLAERRPVALGQDGLDAPDAAGGQLGIHRPHRGPEVWQVQAVQRRDRQPRRVEGEGLGGDPRHQPRLHRTQRVSAGGPATGVT